MIPYILVSASENVILRRGSQPPQNAKALCGLTTVKNPDGRFISCQDPLPGHWMRLSQLFFPRMPPPCPSQTAARGSPHLQPGPLTSLSLFEGTKPPTSLRR